MNKLIIGGVLVAVMGGTPTVTYFLTGGEETSTTDETKISSSQVGPEEVKQGTNSTCQTNESGGDCPAKGEVARSQEGADNKVN